MIGEIVPRRASVDDDAAAAHIPLTHPGNPAKSYETRTPGTDPPRTDLDLTQLRTFASDRGRHLLGPSEAWRVPAHKGARRSEARSKHTTDVLKQGLAKRGVLGKANAATRSMTTDNWCPSTHFRLEARTWRTSG